MKFDKTELEILRLLQADGTMTNEKIGERVGCSASSVSRCISELKKAKVITGVHAAIDPAKLGLVTTVLTLVSLKQHTGGMTDAFECVIDAMPGIVEWARIAGSWDYLLKFMVKDTPRQDELHHKLLALPMVSRLREMRVIDSPRIKPTLLAVDALS